MRSDDGHLNHTPSDDDRDALEAMRAGFAAEAQVAAAAALAVRDGAAAARAAAAAAGGGGGGPARRGFGGGGAPAAATTRRPPATVVTRVSRRRHAAAAARGGGGRGGKVDERMCERVVDLVDALELLAPAAVVDRLCGADEPLEVRSSGRTVRTVRTQSYGRTVVRSNVQTVEWANGRAGEQSERSVRSNGRTHTFKQPNRIEQPNTQNSRTVEWSNS